MLSVCYAGKFFDWFDCNEEKTFERCKDNNGKIYEGYFLGVCKKGRHLGLGEKMVQCAIDYARNQDCSHCFCLTSGIYSQKIMKKKGLEVVVEKNYEDFKDKHGNVLIKNETHKTGQVNVLKL